MVETERLKVKQLENNIICNKSWDQCENNSLVNCDVNIQKEKTHDTEDAPSTSKCGSCDYESDNEDDVNQHVKIKHAFACEVWAHIQKRSEITNTCLPNHNNESSM